MPTLPADALEFPVTILKAASGGDARFVLSAAAPDRVKDTIDPAAWRPYLGKKLIALWQHNSDEPIGYWENLAIDARKLVGDIHFASTQLAKMAKQLIADGVPLGASIGFRAKGERKEDGGYHFSEMDLLEVSIVSVPAHPLATQIAKQFGFTLPAGGGLLPTRTSAATPTPSAAAANPAQPRSPSHMKTISQLVVETQEKQVSLTDRLTAETTKLGELPDGTEEFTTQKAVVDQLHADLVATDGKLATFKASEARLAAGAADGPSRGSPGIVKRDNTDNLMGKLALCVYESRIKSLSIDHVAATRFPGSQAVETIVKAAQNPAMTNVAGYAQELTRMAYGELLEQLRGASILAAVPKPQSYSFEGATSIYVPTRLGGPTDAAGAFRAEGAPIPVKGLMFGHVLLNPKNMGVILTATGEMLRRSAIDLASYFQNAMTKDTGYALDQLFIGNTAGTLIQPAGARNGLGVGETRASTGATAANIATDIKVMVTALASANMGSPSTRWLMHPANAIAVSMLLTATGAPAFPEAASGRLGGYPIVQSTLMPTNIVLLIDFEQYTFAIGSPAFEATTVATLHEENAAPLPIASPGAPATVAAPARSLFQTNSWALRMLLDADWAKLRTPGPVQELTAVAW